MEWAWNGPSGWTIINIILKNMSNMLQDHIWNQHCSRSMFAICSLFKCSVFISNMVLEHIWNQHCSRCMLISNILEHALFDLEYSSRSLMVQDHKVLLNGPGPYYRAKIAQKQNLDTPVELLSSACFGDSQNPPAQRGLLQMWVDLVLCARKWECSCYFRGLQCIVQNTTEKRLTKCSYHY